MLVEKVVPTNVKLLNVRVAISGARPPVIEVGTVSVMLNGDEFAVMRFALAGPAKAITATPANSAARAAENGVRRKFDCIEGTHFLVRQERRDGCCNTRAKKEILSNAKRLSAPYLERRPKIRYRV